MKTTWAFLLVFLLLAAPAAQAQYVYATNNGAITITGYTGPGGAVTIPDTITGLPVTSIGVSAFMNQPGLTSITISTNVTNIGNGAFYNCTGLANATIPSSVTSISYDVFGGCTSLTAISVDPANPAYVSVAGVLFNKTQTTLVEYPSGLSGGYTIPDGVSSIVEDAFDTSTRLTSVTIPTNLISIGDFAFFYCLSLTNVMIPASVTSFGDDALGACTSLAAIPVDPANPVYVSVGGVLFNKTQTTLVQYPGGLGGSYTIPNSVNGIANDAFDTCTSLTNVTIPNSVTSIGVDAFGGCSSLTGFTIPGSVISVGNFAFFYCSSLTRVTILNGVTSIGGGVFYGDNRLTSITIPGSVSSIGSYALQGCGSPASVYFYGNVPKGDSTVFTGDANVTAYYLPGTTGWAGFPAQFGIPAVPWFLPNPLILDYEPSFGIRSNQFGFTVSWATNASIVVEASTNLANPVWYPLATNALAGGQFYFSDPGWAGCPGRFYRIRSP